MTAKGLDDASSQNLFLGASTQLSEPTPVYLREVVKRALELDASALIIVHEKP
jgi:DNA repair protein RadC